MAHVYVAYSPGVPGHAKIGMTTRSPEERVRELSQQTGALPLVVYGAVALPSEADAVRVEAAAHRRLGKRRVAGKEWFRVEPTEAMRVVRGEATPRPSLGIIAVVAAAVVLLVAAVS